MKRWLLRVGLTVGLGWTLAVSSVSAQDAKPPTNGVQPAALQNPGPVIHDMRAMTAPMTAVPSMPNMTNLTAPMVATPPEYAPTVPILPSPLVKQDGWHPIRDCLQGHGFLCFQPHEYPGCGSIRGQWIFFFGSCRQFFGEPCAAGALPPPWLGAGNGGGGGGCGCRP
jgi:hypothetical protein